MNLDIEETLRELPEGGELEKPKQKRVPSAKQLEALARTREKKKTKKVAIDLPPVSFPVVEPPKMKEPKANKPVLKRAPVVQIQADSSSDDSSSSDDEPPTIIIKTTKHKKSEPKLPEPPSQPERKVFIRRV